MKKLFTGLVACFMTVVCLLSVAACSPSLKFDKAEENLRDKGYTVEIEYGIDEMFLKVERSLYAERDDEFIEIYEFEKSSDAKAVYQYYVKEGELEIQNCEREIEFFEYLLKKQKDNLSQEEIEEIEDEIAELKENIDDIKEDIGVIGRKGKCVWVASSVHVVEDAN